MPMDAANFAGFIHAGAPITSRGSTRSATPVTASSANIARPTAVSRASVFHRVFSIVLIVILT